MSLIFHTIFIVRYLPIFIYRLLHILHHQAQEVDLNNWYVMTSCFVLSSHILLVYLSLSFCSLSTMIIDFHLFYMHFQINFHTIFIVRYLPIFIYRLLLHILHHQVQEVDLNNWYVMTSYFVLPSHILLVYLSLSLCSLSTMIIDFHLFYMHFQIIFHTIFIVR